MESTERKIPKIRWICMSAGTNDPSERGYWISGERRFDITPHGYRHNIYPDGYRVTDTLGNKLYAVIDAPAEKRDHGKRAYVAKSTSASFDTVRDCKAWAEGVIAREWDKELS